MRLIRSPAAMQRLALSWRRHGARVGLVPTMGFLHDGHLRLLQRARELAGPDGEVVTSVFVNPTQFGPHEDLALYPRDFPRDRALCRQAGVDVLFAPAAEAMYTRRPGLACSTYVEEGAVARRMEGAARPGHFRGVATVVAKLFNLVLPDFAVFGAKDYQQAAVVRRMVRDLDFPVRIVVAPTVRERDGLALSSRTTYLSPDERRQATVLWRAIQRARAVVRDADLPVASAVLKRELAELIAMEPAARLDYVECFHEKTLEPVSAVRRGVRLALAVYIGRTRLIDNARL